jgi:hypothetical protein
MISLESKSRSNAHFLEPGSHGARSFTISHFEWDHSHHH